MKILYLLREDLRLFDNPALRHASMCGEVQPLYIYPEGLGAASYWWLHDRLKELQEEYSKLGSQLVFRQGAVVDVVLHVAREMKAEQVVWNRVYSPKGIEQGESLKAALNEAGIAHKSFNGQLLIEPTKILTKQATPYKVFTPFWRACREVLLPPQPNDVPKMRASKLSIKSDDLESWSLQPTQPDWAQGLKDRWQPGEEGAQNRWRDFLDGVINDYKDARDIPAKDNTSFLSPHLTFGEISVNQLWHETRDAIAAGDVNETNGNKFLAEIGWREFSRYLLVHFPHIIEQPFNSKFEKFPWQNNRELVEAWQAGKTGYPIVDAGMRELWHTGYMHNRVRMIVASFLTKHCLTHWQVGADWFWDTLVDADIGNNTASWQWVAGCGADASPYFRIFNPMLQSEKFDGKGVYLRKWLPELKEMPNKAIHKPWEASAEVLRLAGVELGKDYPHPVVDHKEARESALQAYQAIRSE